jgi:hypothetical protein
MTEGETKALAAFATVVIGVAFALASGGNAFARTVHRHFHHAGAHGHKLAQPLYVVSSQPIRIGPMRYYGGPKSPMWRAPVEN